MNTITLTYTVCKFDELSDTAKAHALEEQRDINVDYDWWDFLLDDWKVTHLPALGFENAEIYYTGFSHQGHGASFTANVNIPTFIKAHKLGKDFASVLALLRRDWYVACTISKSGHYEHEYTMDASIESDYHSVNVDRENRINTLLHELEVCILEHARDCARKIYRELENEFFYLIRDEAVIETPQSNDYDFTEDGNLF